MTREEIIAEIREVAKRKNKTLKNWKLRDEGKDLAEKALAIIDSMQGELLLWKQEIKILRSSLADAEKENQQLKELNRKASVNPQSDYQIAQHTKETLKQINYAQVTGIQGVKESQVVVSKSPREIELEKKLEIAKEGFKLIENSYCDSGCDGNAQAAEYLKQLNTTNKENHE